jgi:uncharacterized membrane protein
METNTYQIPASQPVNMGKWISEAWQMIQSDLGFFLLLGFIYLAVLTVASGTVIGTFIVAGPMEVSLFYIFFQKMRGKPVEIGNLGKGFEFFAVAILANIVIGVFVLIGFVFCIIPGLLAIAAYQFTYPLILEKRMDFWQAMETSRKFLSQHLFEMTIFIFVKAIIIVIGLLFCCVGVVAAVPLIAGATAFAYRDMIGLEPEA